MPNPINTQDADLAKYFTDVETLRDWFDRALVADVLPKRLLVIWGVGGIGKSSLFRMFRLNCKTAHVPVGLASGDEAKSAVDVLTRWAEDLKSDGVNLLTFSKTLVHYRAIQAKVEDKTNETRKKLGEVAGKAASKTAEAAGGAALGAALGSVIPGIGTAAGAALGGVVGGMGTEALADYLRGFLTKPDIDLLLDPSKKLTEDFLADVNRAALKQRVVLMLDTYEQMTALDDWTRDMAQRLNENVMLGIAGRAMVDWGRQWPEWLMYAQVEELKPMTRRVMHELIRRYYATMRGGEPNSKQVDAIIEFSRGLPMVVNSAVQLWVQYGVEDFQAIRPQVIKDLVERLREGVPAGLYPLLEAAAALRWFNKDVLRAVSGMVDVNAGYEELRRFPFVRVRAEGLALNDAIREFIEENVRMDDPLRYKTLHTYAAEYFEALLARATGDHVDQLARERLYHRICADEYSGINLFQNMAEKLMLNRLVSRLRELLNDINTYSLEERNSQLWRQYYFAGLARMELQISDAEKIYKAIVDDPNAEPKVSAYALCDWGEICTNSERLSQPNGVEQAIKLLEWCQRLVPLDSHLIFALKHLHNVYVFECDLQRGLVQLEAQIHWLEEHGDKFTLTLAYNFLKENYGLLGNWQRVIQAQMRALMELSNLPDSPIMRAKIIGSSAWALIFSGRYFEVERALLECIHLANDVGDAEMSGSYGRDLALVVGLQGKYQNAANFFLQAINTRDKKYGGKWERGISLGFWGLVLLNEGKLKEATDNLSESLRIKQELMDRMGIPELLVGLGVIAEIMQEWGAADSYYARTLNLDCLSRLNFRCGALTGLTRVKHAQSDYAAIPPLLVEAEQLAQQYEYNDHLASLRLTQAQIAWDGHIPEWGNGFDAAFAFYKLALVYALRYNRFLLEEVLSRRLQGTPLRPIIPGCLERSEDGRKMLLALREWWQTGMNDVGAPRPDTISPIPENIPLLEAEKIAREREPGDGSLQKTVIGQLDAALA